MKRWGIFRFTFGEAIRRGTLLTYFLLGNAIILVLLLGIGHVPQNPDQLTFFGNPILTKVPKDFDVVQMLLAFLESQSSFWIMMFGVFGVAGFMPEILEKGSAELFLSKPITRWELLLFRSFGATAGIAANIVYFMAGVWAVVGLKFGVWHWKFLASSLLISYSFACLVVLLFAAGLLMRNTGLVTMFGFIFYVFSWGLESRTRGLNLLWDNAVYHRILDALYYLTPQLSAMLTNATRFVGHSAIANPMEPQTMNWMPYVYSLASATLIYLLSAWYFYRRDY